MRTGLNGGFALADIEPSRSDAVLPDDREGPSATIELSGPGVVVTASDEWPGCVVCKPGLSSAAPQSFGLASRACDDDILLPFAASPDGVALLDPSGLILATNPRAGRMGGAPHAAGPASWLEIWDAPDDRGEAEAALTRARAGHPARFRAAAGPVLWDVTVTPVAGSPPRLLTVARDISEQRQAEARQGVLLMEMEHRLKNTLSIVQAIATQTFATPPRSASRRNRSGRACWPWRKRTTCSCRELGRARPCMASWTVRCACTGMGCPSGSGSRARRSWSVRARR